MSEVIWTPPAPKAGPKPIYSMAEIDTSGATPDRPVVLWSPQLSSDALQLPPDHIRDSAKKVEREAAAILAAPTDAQRDIPAGARFAFTSKDGFWMGGEVLESSSTRLHLRIDLVDGMHTSPFMMRFGEEWPVTFGVDVHRKDLEAVAGLYARASAEGDDRTTQAPHAPEISASAGSGASAGARAEEPAAGRVAETAVACEAESKPKSGESLFATPTHQIITGDALTVLRSLSAGSVHCVVTSPPYWAQRVYQGVDGQVWGGDADCPHQWVTLPTVNQRRSLNEGMSEKQASVGGNLVEYAPGDDCALCGAWRGMLGLEPVPDCLAWARGEEPCSRCYICHLRTIALELWRVLRNDGTLWINLGDKYSSDGGPNDTAQGKASYRKEVFPHQSRLCRAIPSKNLCGLPWRLGLALQADDWYLRQSNIWHKPNGVPHPVKDRPVTNHEYVLLLTKRPRYYYDNEAVKQKARRTASGNKARRFGGEYDRGDHHVGYSIPWQGEKSQLRSVWTINTAPAKSKKHFAAFPERLPELCILAGTSAGGVCSKCGTPYRRVVELGEPDLEQQRACGGDKNGHYNGTSHAAHTREEAGAPNPSTIKSRILAGMRKRSTIGWVAACKCKDAMAIPATVLDPFAGTGTTNDVARRLGRSSLGIEASSVYAEQARERLSRPLTFRKTKTRKPRPVQRELPLEVPA